MIVTITVTIIIGTVAVAVGVTAFIVTTNLVVTIRFVIRVIHIIPIQSSNHYFGGLTTQVAGALIVIVVPMPTLFLLLLFLPLTNFILVICINRYFKESFVLI